MIAVTTQGLQRSDAKGFSYRVKPGTTSRAVEAHRLHLRTEPTDAIVLVSSQGNAWWGQVGRLPMMAKFEDLGLAKGEEVVGLGVLSDSCYLIIGTKKGQVKRVAVDDIKPTAEATWATIIGLSGDQDGVLFAGIGGDEAEAMFFTSARANRFASNTVTPQATPSARGVAAIKVRSGDHLLGGTVVADPAAQLGVVVVSKTGFVKRVPLGEFPVQGRGGQGVLVLNQTKATGPVVAVGTGPLAGSVDLIATDGKRQRLAKVPEEKRPNRGEKLVELDEVAEVWIL